MAELRRKKEKSSLMANLKVIAVLLAFLAALFWGVFYLKASYKGQQKKILSELSAIPALSDEEIGKEAAAELKFAYPVPAPTKSPDEIIKEADAEAKKLAETKFSQKVLAGKITETIKQFAEAKTGDKVSFQRTTVPGAITGTYKGRDGIFVLVDNGKYSFSDIMEEFRYLFDADVATVQAQQKIKELKDDFKKNFEAFVLDDPAKRQEKVFAASGYRKDSSGKWVSQKDLFEKAFPPRKEAAAKARNEEMKKILVKYRIIGIFPVKVSDEEIKKAMGK